MAQAQYIATGRRKNSTARVRLVPGTGKIVFNGKEMAEYLPYESLFVIVKQPLAVTQTEGLLRCIELVPFAFPSLD